MSTTPITAMGCWQGLPLSVVQLKGKHCRTPHCRNGVVDTFRLGYGVSRHPKVEIVYMQGTFITTVAYSGMLLLHILQTYSFTI